LISELIFERARQAPLEQREHGHFFCVFLVLRAGADI
jgi:hypothetical protein